MVLSARPDRSIPAWRRATLRARGFKPALFALALLPLAALIERALRLQLGANPAQAVIWSTGLWALRLLLLTLAVTPLRVLTGWDELARLRRMLGLFAFSYACLHVLAYLALVVAFDPAQLLHNIAAHPFVLAGFSAWLLLLALAASSPQRVVRWLGGARWRALHRLVYAAALLAVWHFWWGKQAKHDIAVPAQYAALLGLLLGWRLWRARPR